MKFLLDQDVYAATLRFLSDLGYDVVPVAQIGLSRADDSDLLRKAQELVFRGVNLPAVSRTSKWRNT